MERQRRRRAEKRLRSWKGAPFLQPRRNLLISVMEGSANITGHHGIAEQWIRPEKPVEVRCGERGGVPANGCTSYRRGWRAGRYASRKARAAVMPFKTADFTCERDAQRKLGLVLCGICGVALPCRGSADALWGEGDWCSLFLTARGCDWDKRL